MTGGHRLKLCQWFSPRRHDLSTLWDLMLLTCIFPPVFWSCEAQSVKVIIKDSRCDANKLARWCFTVQHLQTQTCMLLDFLMSMHRLKWSAHPRTTVAQIRTVKSQFDVKFKEQDKNKQIINKNKEDLCSWLINSHSSLAPTSSKFRHHTGPPIN